MSKRIGEVISQIFRHPLGVRQVIALSRGDAKQIPLLPGVAMLSITAPGSSPARLPDYEFLLRLSFSDVNFMADDLSSRAKQKLETAMTKGQAVEVHVFIKELPSTIHTLLVHCEGGFSRSCGVAAALKAIYGYEAEEARLMKANPSVMKMLVATAIRP